MRINKAGRSGALRALAVALVGATVMVGCSSKSPSTTSSAGQPSGGPTPIKSPAPRSTMSLPPYNPTIDPAKFSAQITNPYYPLPQGTTFIYDGTRDGVPRRDEVTVTRETKLIMGVPCIVVRDVVTSNNALVEKTTDWYAQDSEGNVWYFGEDTAEYTNGAVSSTAGTWMAGVDGALPGLIMKASPSVGDAYRQEYRPGVAEDFARILKTNAAHKVAAGTYPHVVITEDTDLLDTTKLENKFYARGVGFLGSEGMVSGHHEVTRLTSILKAG